MEAVVLVGGEGTRLRPLTLSTPKQMLPIVDQPMIERVLGQLAHHGIDRAVLSLGYLPDAFRRAYPEGMVAGVSVSYAVEPTPLDTAGAVRFAARAARIDETFVVVNGDVLTDLDVSRLVAFHRDRGAEGTIALHAVSDPSAFGVVPTDAAGKVEAFVEKPRREAAPTNLINAGTYVLEPSVLERIVPDRRVSIERETFPAMVADGSLFAMDDGGAYWLDTGTPAAYLQANLDLIEGRSGPPGPEARELSPGVWVRGAPVVSGAVVAPAFLADGATVAGGAKVARCVLGPGCTVASDASVTGSVLLAGASVGEKARVVGSVLGPGAQVGEGCDVRPVSVLGAGARLRQGAVVDGERVPA